MSLHGSIVDNNGKVPEIEVRQVPFVHFTRKMAQAIGVNEAILIELLDAQYISTKQGHEFGYEQWREREFYINLADLSQQLPFWNDEEIKAILFSLREQKIIEIAFTSDNQYGWDGGYIITYTPGNDPKIPDTSYATVERTVKPKPKPRAGYVYLMGGGGYFKIGLSVDVDIRFEQIYPIMPFEIAIIHKIKTNNMRKLEQLWHKRFAFQRAQGEWFKLDDAHVLEFCAQDEMQVPQ